MIGVKLPSQFVRDVLNVGLTQVLVSILLALLLRVMADWLGTEGMGAYLVMRRFIEITSVIALLSLEVGLARYVALYPNEAQEYLGWGVLLTTIISSALIFFAWFAGDVILADLDLGGSDLASLVLPAVLFLTGTLYFALLYAYLRGQQRMTVANVLQLAFFSIVLIIAFSLSLISQGSIEMLFVYFCVGGGATLIFSTIYLLKQKFQIKLARHQLQALMRFGLPRIPAGFFLSLTLSIPLFVAAQQEKLEIAALLGISLALLKLLESAVSPIGVMLLPKITDLVRQDDPEQLKIAGLQTISATLYLAVFVSLMTPGLSPELIHIWFGVKYLAAVPIAKITLLAAGPYLVYVILRSVLNAVSIWPIVTLLTGLSAATVAVSTYFVRTEIGLAYSLAIGLSFLGMTAFLAVIYLLKIIPRFGFVSFCARWYYYAATLVLGFAQIGDSDRGVNNFGWRLLVFTSIVVRRSDKPAAYS